MFSDKKNYPKKKGCNHSYTLKDKKIRFAICWGYCGLNPDPIKIQIMDSNWN